jgi:hypothetical protein
MDHETDAIDEEPGVAGAYELYDGAPAVGYKRPPNATRFRKGKSGNSKGRPKGSENLSKILQDVLGERISVSEGGKLKRMSKAEALVQLMFNHALKGDIKAIGGILEFADKIGRTKQPSEDGQTTPGVVLVPDKVSEEEWERLYGAAARGERHAPGNSESKPRVTRPFSIASGDKLVSEGKLDEALACYRLNLAQCEAKAANDYSNDDAKKELLLAGKRIGYVGGQFIGTGEFSKALDAIDQALQYDPDATELRRLRVLALMLEGNVHQARALYLEHQGESSWEEGVLSDFAEGRLCGYTHPLMDEIEILFNASAGA